MLKNASRPLFFAILLVAALSFAAIANRGSSSAKAAPQAAPQAQRTSFHLEEATIGDVHQAIRSGQITCRQLVQWYLNRARVYNGVGTQLVTEDMAPAYFPNYDEYKKAVETTADLAPGDPRKTLAIEFGRMEATATDPAVQAQFGMIVGIPHAKKVSALATLNIRGERSVTCKGDRDKKENRPAGTPAVCAEFSQQPDALEQAAALDARYGRNPDLTALPMYCIPFSFKDSFDTTDMHSDAGADARYDIDFPARDHTVVAELRKKGAIIYAKAVQSEYNGLGGDPGGKHFPATELESEGIYNRSTWGGNPNNLYDTTRVPSLGSSSGSAVSVSANLVMCSICEETRASCRGPSNHNSVALILPHKGMVSFLGGAIGSDVYNDRTGIMCRTIGDAAKVLDAIRDPVAGYYDPRDVFTTVGRPTISSQPYSTAIQTGPAGALRGLRIGIVREFMVKQTKADEPIVDAVETQIKEVLGKQLGATLVESVTPGWTPDPTIQDMTTSFDRAIAQLVPVLFPDLMYRLTPDGQPLFPDFAAKIKPTEFAPGVVKGTGDLAPADWMVRWADGREPNPRNLNLRSILGLGASNTFRFHIPQYLARRAQDWADRGFTETLVDFPSLNARSKFYSDRQRAAFLNWEDVQDLREPIGARQGIAERVQLRELLARVVMKVIQENKLDILINVHDQLPPGRIGLAQEPPVNNRGAGYALGPDLGWTEVLIPAGYVRTVYDPTFELATDAHGRKFYRSKTSAQPTAIPAPGLPYSISFWSEPGMERLTLKVASAYEAASKRRVPPPAFGAIPGEP